MCIMENKLDHISDHFGLVGAIARKYSNYGVPYDDLLQEGVLGLIEAEKRFDKSKNVQFSTYATYWIKKKILGTLTSEREHTGIRGDESEFTAGPEPGEESGSGEHEHISLTFRDDFPETEAEILRLSFEESRPLDEIGQILGITREHARQLKNKALRRLRINKGLT